MTEANLPSTLLELLKPLQRTISHKTTTTIIVITKYLKTIQALNKQIPPLWGMAAIV